MTFPPPFARRYRLLLCYDIRAESYEAYYQFVMSEFVPALQGMGLYMAAVWHTAYGDYPIRQVEFIADSLETIREIFNSDQWRELEGKLLEYTHNYERKLVRYKERFQF